SRLRLASADAFGDHTAKIEPAFPLWIDTFRPELERRRWYHRFSALTARAGGFDLVRDVRTGHGPLGAMYPTNTTHWQKEGDTMTFLYLVPNGLSEPEQPAWGSWAGRYGPNENYPGKLYYWANASDHWQGSAHRENSLRRWAVHLQNDFKARLDWCVKDFPDANHPPRPKLDGDSKRVARPGETIVLDASASTDPDGDAMAFEWIFYPEPSGYAGPLPVIENAHSDRVTIVLPASNAAETLHFVLILTDRGDPPLTRYQRVIVSLQPR
ncbi:MAG: nucleoside hydrolase-like domain-containing protein, partial [Verrucomicrobiota bacterium]